MLSDEKGNQVTLSKDLFYGIIIMGLVVLVVISALTQGFGIVKSEPLTCPPCNADTGGAAQQPAANVSAQQPDVKTMVLPALLADSPLMGSEESGVTVLEFSDFQCPFCGLAFGSPWAEGYTSQYGPIIGTVQKVEDEYAQAGKAAFRHYPVGFLGQESIDASNAALCANAQGKYWEMHAAIYEAQTPEENDGKYSKANLKVLAEGITGLDQAAFASCLDADTYVNDVQDFTTDWQDLRGQYRPRRHADLLHPRGCIEGDRGEGFGCGERGRL